MPRAVSKAIGRLLIGVVLFAQLALASYACPAFNSALNPGANAPIGGIADATAAARSTGMPADCDQMDPDAANLCIEHCRQGQQGVDTAAVPLVSVGIATLLYPLSIEPRYALGSGRPFPAVDAGLAPAPEPPHAILHCVFRI